VVDVVDKAECKELGDEESGNGRGTAVQVRRLYVIRLAVIYRNV
jgi:hypothetical protein